MKNVKNWLSSAALVAAAAWTLTACSDYDAGYTEEKVKYIEDFKSVYGDIDPAQDWNLAERQTVTVSTETNSTIEVYALVDGTYSLVADYVGVNGTEELGFDAVEGTEQLIVTDGATSVHTQVGGTAIFGARIVSTDNFAVSVGNYIEFPKEKAVAYETVLPEINNNTIPYEQTNLPKVTKNFKYVSNGSFSFYPIYWDTSGSPDAIYVYWTDGSGLHKELVYTPKSGDELQNLYETQFNYSSTFADKANQPGTTEAEFMAELRNKTGVSNFAHDASTNTYTWTYNSNDYIYHAGKGNFVPAKWEGDSFIADAYINCLRAENVGSKPSTAGYEWKTGIVSQRSREIIIDIPEGVTFGFAIENGSDFFYSEASKNPTYGSALGSDRFAGTQWSGKNGCYAASIAIDGEQYLCFEDWYDGDFDLNDLVFKFDGNVPTVIDEDPTAATWILACEDLGGSFDTDYNDIVLQVEHISGQTIATVTPLAAGGTLASYIFFQDPTTSATETCLGEIHQLFGATPAASGSYEPINVGRNRGTAGTPKTITVGKDWTMAYYSTESFATSQQYENFNMGGFSIYVLPTGTAALTGTVYSTNSAFGTASIVSAPNAGDAPEIVCLPYSYVTYNTPTTGKQTETVWAWPLELHTIADGNGGGAYPLFAGWVNNHNTNTDWYKHPNGNTVSELSYVTDMPNASSNGSGDDDDDNNNSDDSTLPGETLTFTLWQAFTYVNNAGAPTQYTNAALIDLSGLSYPSGYTATIHFTLSEPATNKTIYWDYKNGRQMFEDKTNGGNTTGHVTLTAEQLYKAQQTGGIYVVGAENTAIPFENVTIEVTPGSYIDPSTWTSDESNGTVITPVATNVYPVQDVLNAANGRETITIILEGNSIWNNKLQMRPYGENGTVWDTNYFYNESNGEGSSDYCTFSTPVSYFQKLKDAGYSNFQLTNGNITTFTVQ